MKTGVIDVGGGLRGIYAAGVLDYCIDKEIWFDLGIGVSAGSANLSSYAAKQRGRNYQFYTEYSFRKQYMSVRNFLLKHSFMDMDYIYGTLSVKSGEYPLDYPTLRDNPMEFYVVSSNALTGEAKYFDKHNIRQDCYDIMKASSSIPFVCPPYPVDGEAYFDGALADPVPVAKAFELGCERVVVILTKPENVIRDPKNDEAIASRIQRKYPAAAENLRMRAMRYNCGVALAQKYAEQGKAIIIAPDDTCGVDTLKKNRVSLEKLYRKGYRDGEKITAFFARDCDGKA